MLKRWTIAAAMLGAACLGAATARADHPGAGSSMFWIGLNGDRAQLVGPTTGSITTFENPEAGVHVSYAYFVSDAWTVELTGGYDFGRSRFEPANPLARTETFTSRSYSLRLGGDRFAFINDQVALYAGPGILYWRGSGKYAGSGTPGVDGDWPTVTQIAINGRIGMWARLAGPWALFGHIGQVIGDNRASDSNGKNDWWSSHHEGSVGLAFDY
jgi:hypothetical protein